LVEVFGVEGADDGEGVARLAQGEGDAEGGAGTQGDGLQGGEDAAVGQTCTGGEDVGAGIELHAAGKGVLHRGFLGVGEELQAVVVIEAREGEMGVVLGIGDVARGAVGEDKAGGREMGNDD
jgi:hypothetical protein